MKKILQVEIISEPWVIKGQEESRQIKFKSLVIEPFQLKWKKENQAGSEQNFHQVLNMEKFVIL